MNILNINCMFQMRKSQRIALRDQSPSPVESPKYVSKPYNIAELCKWDLHCGAEMSCLITLPQSHSRWSL